MVVNATIHFHGQASPVGVWSFLRLPPNPSRGKKKEKKRKRKKTSIFGIEGLTKFVCKSIVFIDVVIKFIGHPLKQL